MEKTPRFVRADLIGQWPLWSPFGLSRVKAGHERPKSH
jgi:hypothetical protein